MTDEDPRGPDDAEDHGWMRRDGPAGDGATERPAPEARYVWPRERARPRYVESASAAGRHAAHDPIGGDATDAVGAADVSRAGGPEGASPTAGSGRARRAEQHRRRRRRGTVLALCGLVVLGLAAYFGGKAIVGSLFPTVADYAGSGEDPVVVQVTAGQTTTQIAETLVSADIVESSRAFLDAANGNAAMSVLSPGYYQMRTRMSGAAAVRLMTSDDARVGALVVPEGRRLSDVTTVGGDTTAGILSLISEASCIDDGSGSRTCMGADELADALSASDPASMGVPGWALARVQAVDDPVHRYEGMIKAGSWNFDPTAEPRDVLRTLITESADAYTAQGLETAGSGSGLSPYDTLVAASLLEGETPPQDFPKVARVILNRLDADQKLQFDSTVNYGLDRQEVATTDADRGRRTPWNTYAMKGLPATPISSPGDEALHAAENPAHGDWLYFVTIDKDGTTVFTDNYDDHLANIEKARESGVLDSGR